MALALKDNFCRIRISFSQRLCCLADFKKGINSHSFYAFPKLQKIHENRTCSTWLGVCLHGLVEWSHCWYLRVSSTISKTSYHTNSNITRNTRSNTRGLSRTNVRPFYEHGQSSNQPINKETTNKNKNKNSNKNTNNNNNIFLTTTTTRRKYSNIAYLYSFVMSPRTLCFHLSRP